MPRVCAGADGSMKNEKLTANEAPIAKDSLMGESSHPRLFSNLAQGPLLSSAELKV